MITPKIRIRLRSYDYKLLDKSVWRSWRRPGSTGARVAGPIPLPTEINKFDGAAFAPHRQEVPGAVRDAHL